MWWEFEVRRAKIRNGGMRFRMVRLCVTEGSWKGRAIDVEHSTHNLHVLAFGREKSDGHRELLNVVRSNQPACQPLPALASRKHLRRVAPRNTRKLVPVLSHDEDLPAPAETGRADLAVLALDLADDVSDGLGLARDGAGELGEPGGAHLGSPSCQPGVLEVEIRCSTVIVDLLLATAEPLGLGVVPTEEIRHVHRVPLARKQVRS